MQLIYGSYVHADSEATVQIGRTPVYNDGGQMIGVRERWNVSGFLQAANGAALTTALQQLRLAYAIQGQTIGLFFADGTPTNHILISANCVGGTRVVEGPSFPQGGPSAEYVENGPTFRTYTLAVEGTVLTHIGLLAFNETLSFQGTTGPRVVWKQTLNGFPQRQQTTDRTTQKITQAGSAIGQFAYPVVPGPLWPAYELVEQRNISPGNPKRTGPVGRPTYVEWPVSWRYAFETGVPATGQPNRWLG